jgi:hypothetical protein
MHDEILDLCRASGVEPTLGPPLRELQEAEALVATGAGWFLTIEGNAPLGVQGLAVRRLPEPEPETRVALVWRGVGPSAPAAAFIAVAREAAEAGRLPALPHGARA